MQVFTDFDGTIAEYDVTDLVLANFASHEWEAIQEQWLSGQIDALTCLREQFALVEANQADVDGVLDTVALDPGFPEFVRWCQAQSIELTIVSDGLDYFIKRVLGRHGYGDLPLYCNKVRIEERTLKLQHPFWRPECRVNSGVCKCSVVGNLRTPSQLVYIGDGRSDECVVSNADIVFAKDRLANYCVEQKIPFTAFRTFTDVRGALSSMLKDDGGARTLLSAPEHLS